MADKVIRRNYLAMIDALSNFSARTAQIGTDIQQAANRCRQILGDEDVGIQGIFEHAVRSQRGYQMLAGRALKIAGAMYEELDRSELERMVWEDEE